MTATATTPRTSHHGRDETRAVSAGGMTSIPPLYTFVGPAVAVVFLGYQGFATLRPHDRLGGAGWQSGQDAVAQERRMVRW